MVDFRSIGNSGLMIQYEDIVSLVGYNIISYFKANGYKNETLNGMSEKDILVSYINRSTYSPTPWMKDTFDVKCCLDDFNDSDVAFRPNNLYAYKMFTASKKENIKNLIIYSDQYSPIIEKNIQTFQISDVKYEYGDLCPILNKNPNITFTTSNPEAIKRCLQVEPPIMLAIVDDFLYLSDLINDSKTVDELRKRGKYVMYTSLSQSGTV